MAADSDPPGIVRKSFGRVGVEGPAGRDTAVVVRPTRGLDAATTVLRQRVLASAAPSRLRTLLTLLGR